MYSVSDAFLEAVAANTRNFYWAGKITTTDGTEYEFGYENILKGSGYISAQCCGSTEIEHGTVYSAELGITLFLEVDRYSLEDAIIELSCFLRLSDGTYEEVPMGIFEVSEANRTGSCLELTAYDYMVRFEEDFNGFQSSGTAYDFINLCCTACDVEMAQTQEEIEAMANGSTALAIYSEDDIETYRDVLYYTAQVLGGFFVINREGKLELRKYGSDAVMEITQEQRFSSSFSDFITRYTAISSTNERTETAEYYSVDPDDALTMNLGVNPLLQFGLTETREYLLTNILEDLQEVNYVPFDSETIGNPALDLGDILVFSGGSADETQITCITSIQYNIGGRQTHKCVGKNPRLSSAKSKNDKNIAGLLSDIEEGQLGIYTYTNASAFTIGSTDVEIIAMEFTAQEETDAQFIAQVMIEVDADEVTKTATASGTITVPLSDSSDSFDTDSDTEDSTDSDSDDSSDDDSTDSSSSVTKEDTSMILVMSYLSDSSVDSDMKKLLFEAVEADFENNTIVCIDYTSSAVTISKVRIPILSIGLNELIDDTTAEVIETYTITCSTFAPSSTYHCFLDGGDGYWYGLGNSANSSGDATLKWIKISKDDYSYEEGSYTLSGVTLVYAGSRSYSSYPSNRTKSVMRDGYAYIPAYDLTGVYKINIGNEADISLIELGFTSGGKSLSNSSYGLFLDKIGDLIIGYDYQITADDEVIATAGGAKFPYTCTPMMQYKNFILCWGGEYGSANRYLALLTPYMASICNLGSEVVKTSDMTMKIIYTLTEADSTEDSTDDTEDSDESSDE